MEKLQFGYDIRLSNVMVVEALCAEDATILLEDFQSVLPAVGIDEDTLMEIYDGVELVEYLLEVGAQGLFAYASTPVPQMSECGEYIEALSWGYYANLPIYGRTLEELKSAAYEKVMEYRKRKMER